MEIIIICRVIKLLDHPLCINDTKTITSFIIKSNSEKMVNLYKQSKTDVLKPDLSNRKR